MRLIGFLVLFLVCSTSTIQAQEQWNLEKCINTAWANSLQIKQTAINGRQTKLNAKQAKWAQWPTVNGSIRHGVNFGRSIDLTSYQFVNNANQSTNLSISINAPLYQGLRIRNSIKQSQIDIEANLKDEQQLKEDLALSVAQAYLGILLAEENAKVLKEQTKVTQAQYEQTLKMIKAGALPENAKYDLEAQLALDEENIVRADNSVILAYLTLKTTMNIDPAKEITIEYTKIDVPESVEILTLDNVYDEAKGNQANLLAAKLREESARYGVRIAKGALVPSISAYSALGTNYSSAARRVNGTDTIQQVLTGDLSGAPFSFNINQEVPSYEPNPFFNQLGQNFSQSIGIQVQIPIFNGLQSRIAIERAELAVELAQLNTKTLEVQLKSNVQRALTDVQAAEKRLKAAKRSLVATRASVENTRKRFDLGVVNAFELTSVQNRLIAVESNVLQAKYDYIFKLKILDYYRGIAIQLD
ncbi:MAG: TolC family protein [Saprospiraceae bacterium]|nr:TolC family protein [Saprospiraceae bacterium]